MSSNNQITEALNLTAKAIQMQGWGNVKKALIELTADNSKYLYQQKLAEEIVRRCVVYYDISHEDLFKYHKRGNVTTCRIMCYILIMEHLETSGQEIGRYFYRTKQIIYRAINGFNQIKENPITPEHKKMVKDYESLNKKIISYKTKLSNKKK